MKYVLSVDVGGTFVKTALVNENLEIFEKKSFPTAQNNPDGTAVANQIKSIYQEYKKENSDKSISSLGFATPGASDESIGLIHWAGNFGWKNIPIKQLVADRVDIPVAFGHDVRVAMLAECKFGNAAEVKDAIFIPIGTGIAAAIQIQNKIIFNQGFVGEIGHLKVGHSRKCVCGQIGCLEAIASSAAISQNYFELTQINRETPEIIELAKSEDLNAKKVFQQAILGLANACEALITILAPEKIILGGGLSKAGNNLIDPIVATLKNNLTFQKMPEIVVAKFGSDAGIIGNAIQALELIK